MEEVARQRQAHKKVKALYGLDSNLVNSDKRLLMRFWQSEGLHLDQDQKERFMKCTPAGSITRAARFLRAEMKLEAAKPVLQIREEKFNTFRNVKRFITGK